MLNNALCVVTVWSNLRKFVVTFRAGLPGQLRAAVPPSASEPRSMFTPGVFQHRHLLATRAAQRVTAGTWVSGREPRCWSRLRSKRVASGPRFTAELTRSVTGPCGPGTCRCALRIGWTAPRERRGLCLLKCLLKGETSYETCDREHILFIQ